MIANVPEWFDVEADALDTDAALAGDILPRLVEAGFAGAGFADTIGGRGGDVVDAVEAIAAVSARSLTSGFVLWGHRTFIEYLCRARARRCVIGCCPACSRVRQPARRAFRTR